MLKLWPVTTLADSIKFETCSFIHSKDMIWASKFKKKLSYCRETVWRSMSVEMMKFCQLLCSCIKNITFGKDCSRWMKVTQGWPHLYLAPPLGWPHWNFTYIFGNRKLGYCITLFACLAILAELRIVVTNDGHDHSIYHSAKNIFSMKIPNSVTGS